MPYIPKPSIPGFEIIEKIGEGGMGSVWKARQLSLDRVVAVKVLAEPLAADENYIERFYREIRTVAKLNHPNIVRVFEASRAGKLHYFVMEYVEGRPLTRRLRELGRVPEKEAMQIALGVARGLHYAWDSEKLVHRDIKPDNILITRDGAAKITDFGLVKRAQFDEDKDLAAAGLTVGTPHYISPEQASGDELDGRADLYSLGATLYHALAGQPPFADGTASVVMNKHLNETPPDPRKLNMHLSESAAAIVDKLLKKKRAERYQTAQELIADIETFLEGEKPKAFFEKYPPPPPPRRWPKFAAAAAIVLLIAALATTWVWSMNRTIVHGCVFGEGQGGWLFFIPHKYIPPPPEPPPEPAPTTDPRAELYASAREFAANHAGQFTVVLARLQEVRPQLANTQYTVPLLRLIDDVEHQRKVAAEESFDQLNRRSRQFVEADQFTQAAAVFDELPAELREPRVLAKIRDARATIEGRARQRLAQPAEEFRRLLKEGKRDEAAEQLKLIERIDAPQTKGLLDSLRKELEPPAPDATNP